MAHHHTHGGYARAAQRRNEAYIGCATCGQRSHRFQAAPQESSDDFWPALAVAVLLVAAAYSLVLVMAGAAA